MLFFSGKVGEQEQDTGWHGNNCVSVSPHLKVEVALDLWKTFARFTLQKCGLSELRIPFESVSIVIGYILLQRFGDMRFLIILRQITSCSFQLCSRCSFCECELETIKHLYLHCRETVLWYIFINQRGISWAMPRNIKEALACWNRDGNQPEHWERWNIVPACIPIVYSFV